MHLRHISPGSTDWLDAVSGDGDDGHGRGGGKPQGPEERPRLHAVHADSARERPVDRRRVSPESGSHAT
jgi:hypothetical protein